MLRSNTLALTLALPLLASIWPVACRSAAPAAASTGAPDGREPLATIARNRCAGTCPVYRLAVFADGSVEYFGEQFVKVMGRATGHLSAAQIAAIERLFAENHYLDMGEQYVDFDASDTPMVTTSYSLGGRRKRVEHHHGDGNAPPELTTVEDGLDRLAGVDQWVGTPEERRDFDPP